MFGKKNNTKIVRYLWILKTRKINVLNWIFTEASFNTLIGTNTGFILQNFVDKFVRFFVTLGLKILRFIRLKVLFEADINKGWYDNYCINHKVPIFYQ